MKDEAQAYEPQELVKGTTARAINHQAANLATFAANDKARMTITAIPGHNKPEVREAMRLIAAIWRELAVMSTSKGTDALSIELDI